MKMSKLLNKKVVKMSVKDLKEALKDADDESDVILTFYMKDKGLYSVYLAEVLTGIKYDSVLKESLFEDKVVELSGFNHDYCTYMEKKDE